MHEMPEPTTRDWVLFGLIIAWTIVGATLFQNFFAGAGLKEFLRSYMGVFFLTFSIFKLLDLKGFVMSYMGYDLVARHFPTYAYIYPFIELGFGTISLANLFISTVAWVELVVMAVGAAGVLKQLSRGSNIRCACLGTYVKLPLTTVSLVEDLAMVAAAIVMIVL